MMKKKFLLVNNIPTPYRCYMYENLYRCAQKFNIDMEVAFLARTEPGRFWNPDAMPKNFPYFFSRDRHGNVCETFNHKVAGQDIMKRLRAGEFDWVLATPAQSLANWRIMGTPFPYPAKRILYSETNVYSARRHSGWRRFCRNMIYRHCDALMVPGVMARDFLVDSLPKLAEKPCFFMPNVVDPTVFDRSRERVPENREKLRRHYGILSDVPLLVGIGMARYKNWLALLDAFPSIHGKVQVALLGDGELMSEIRRREAPPSIKLILPGFVSQEQVADYLTMADGYIHTAFYDPSPLCCVEAAYNALPLLLSRQTGNQSELLKSDSNGWLFDARNPTEIATVIDRFLETPDDQWRQMGDWSHDNVSEHFDIVKLGDQFFSWILQLG